jgi:hypothetical protein
VNAAKQYGTQSVSFCSNMRNIMSRRMQFGMDTGDARRQYICQHEIQIVRFCRPSIFHGLLTSSFICYSLKLKVEIRIALRKTFCNIWRAPKGNFCRAWNISSGYRNSCRTFPRMIGIPRNVRANFFFMTLLRSSILK